MAADLIVNCYSHLQSMSKQISSFYVEITNTSLSSLLSKNF